MIIPNPSGTDVDSPDLPSLLLKRLDPAGAAGGGRCGGGPRSISSGSATKAKKCGFGGFGGGVGGQS